METAFQVMTEKAQYVYCVNGLLDCTSLFCVFTHTLSVFINRVLSVISLSYRHLMCSDYTGAIVLGLTVI